jgi:hypothetical protein
VQETLYTANKWKTKSDTSLLIHRQFFASLVLETNFSLLIAAGSGKFALSVWYWDLLSCHLEVSIPRLGILWSFVCLVTLLST